jgi:hypothetical protein
MPLFPHVPRAADDPVTSGTNRTGHKSSLEIWSFSRRILTIV